MKFKLVLEGDLDHDLTLTAEMGSKTVSGKVTTKGRSTKCPGLAALLPDPDDEVLEEGMEALSGGIMEFFHTLYGNV